MPPREGYKMNYIDTEDMQDIVAWRIMSKVDRSFARVVESVIAQEVHCTPSCEDSSYWAIKFSIRVVKRILQMLDNFKMQLESLLTQLEEEESMRSGR